MLATVVLLLQIATVQAPREVTFVHPGAGVETIFTLDAAGRPVQAVVRRLDGKPMTCLEFAAWFAQEYTCTGNCGSTFAVYGTGQSAINRFNACEAARTDACEDATCMSGTYQFCALIHSYSGRETSECVYGRFSECVVADDCSVE